MILRFDISKTAPRFETLALEYFKELHDRTLVLQKRIKQGRRKAFPFSLRIEEVEELLKAAREKFRHLEMMIPENPERETVRTQLKSLLTTIEKCLGMFVGELIDETQSFYDYDDHVVEYDRWMHETAFPQFDQIFKRYEECSVDMVSFDRDLDDFKGVLGAIKRQEAKYYDTMNDLIERYSDLNSDIGDLFKRVEAFDPALIEV